jgi:hypothetical protein
MKCRISLEEAMVCPPLREYMEEVGLNVILMEEMNHQKWRPFDGARSVNRVFHIQGLKSLSWLKSGPAFFNPTTILS